MRSLVPFLAALFLPLFSACTAAPSASVRHPLLDSRAVADRLDRLHAAASKADFNAYFECFTTDAVFLGTDASERWTVEQFKAYCKPYFDAGHGWTYTPHDRHILVQDCWPNASTAWFDELLDNDKYGTCRGSGILLFDRNSNLWKIAQYNLSFTIPNDKAAAVADIVRTKN